MSWTSGRRIFIYSTPVDLRKSYEGLSQLVCNELEEDVLNGSLFLFLNKGRDRLKILFFDTGGFCLFCKRLEKGRFRLPQNKSDLSAKVILDEVTLALILKGFDPKIQKKLPRFSPQFSKF